MAEGIKVGDGVLKFLADTTNLETGYQKVDEAPSHLKPASDAVDQLGNKFVELGREANSGTDMVVDGTRKVEYSAEAARAEVALLGEETGVKLPRHIRGFVAELPGVGKALSAAFEATAVLILVQVLVEATQKIIEFYTNTFVLTDSMKENSKAISESNAKIVAYAKQLEELKRQFLLIGKEGSEKFRIELGLLNKDLDDQKKKFADLGKEVINLMNSEEQLTLERIASEGFLSRMYDKTIEFLGGESSARKEVREEIVKAQNQYLELGKQIQVTKQQEKNLHKELTVQIAKENEELQRKYDTATKELQRLMQEQVKLVDEMNKLANVRPFDQQIEQMPAIVTQIMELQKAYQTLGFTSISGLNAQLHDEKIAVSEVEKAYKQHLATLHDVHVAKLRLVQDEIAVATAQGKSTTALKQQEQELKKQIPELKQYGKTAHDVANAAGSAITQSAFAWGQGAITITQAVQQIAAAVTQSIAQIAEKKGVEQLALAFGSWPDFSAMSHHFAAAGLWFGLAGGISAAAGAVGGSSAGSGTVANPVSTTDNNPATQAQQQKPIVITGVQHFATGGLITQPTLAMMAEKPGQKELAIPLDDPQAHEQIKKAIGGGSDGSIVINVKGLVSPDNLTKVVKKMNKMVKTRKVSLVASSAKRAHRVGGQ